MKKLIMFVMVLAIATPAVALIWEPHTQGFAGCTGSGQVIWEFTEAGCMPTSDVADPPYFFNPAVPDPTFGNSYATDGGPVEGWTWSDGVYTVSDEDGLNQPIPDRGGKQYLRMYFEVVHTMVEGDDPSFIGMGMELWNRLDWPGCPAGADFIGSYDGIWFPTPTDTFDLGGGWHQTYWMFDFSTDGSVGIETFPDLHEATHTTFLIGMLDEIDFSVTPFDIEEVYINYIWYNDTDGGDIPTTDCLFLPEPGKKPLIVNVNNIPVYEPQDCDGPICGPPPSGPTDGQLQVSLGWRPGEPNYPNFTVCVVVDPDPNQEITYNADFRFPDSTEPNDNITLYFTQANWSQYQNVHVEATEDLLREGNQTFKVEFTITIDIDDPNFGSDPCSPVTQTKGIEVIDNDIPFISAVPNAFALSETDPCVPECFAVRLSHLPAATVEVIVVADGDAFDEEMFIIDPNFEDWTDPNRMTFTATTSQPWVPATMTSGWNVPQTICVEARDNDWLTEARVVRVPGVILLNGLSDDIRYQSSEEGGELDETIVNVLVEDNECGSVGYPIYDKNEDCYVDLSEVATLYGQWLDCTQPYDGGKDGWVDCEPLWGF